MNKQIEQTILNATGRALATSGSYGINVIPVSVAKVRDNQIHLFDFFMGKTVENLKADDRVALACWEGLSGVQVKATAEYVTEGDIFTEANTWAKKTYPERILRGVLVLSPTGCFSVTPVDDSRIQLEL